MPKMRTREIVRDDRKSMYQLAVALDGRIVGETPAAGMGRILSETLGARPEQGAMLDDYLQRFASVSHGEDGRSRLVDRLLQAFHTFRDTYHEIQDDYLRYGREYCGWAVYILNPIKYK